MFFKPHAMLIESEQEREKERERERPFQRNLIYSRQPPLWIDGRSLGQPVPHMRHKPHAKQPNVHTENKHTHT